MPPSASGSERRLLLLVLAGALAWRLLCFVGVNGGDDPKYSEQARVPLSSLPEDLRRGGPTVMRVGLLAPTRLSYALMGAGERAAAVYPMACAMGTVALAWWTGRRLLGAAGGLVAAGIAALCPISAGWSSVLGPDIPMGFWASASAALLLAGRRGWAGLLLGMAVATRESACFLVPLAVAAAWAGGRGRGIALLLAGLAAGLWLPAPDGRVYRGLLQYACSSYLSRSPEHVTAPDLEVLRAEMGEGMLGRWRMLLPGDPRFRAFGGIATLGALAALLALVRRKGEKAWVGAWGLLYLLAVLLAASPSAPGEPLLAAQPRYLLPALVPLSVLCAWALPRRPVLLALWAAYLLYEGALGSMQQRAYAKPWREVSAWLDARSEPRVYGPLWGVATLRFLRGYAEPPAFEVYPCIPEWWAPGAYLRQQLGMPAVRGMGPSWDRGSLVLVDLDRKDPEPYDRVEVDPRWTEVKRWTVVTERGPRALLGLAPPRTRTLAAYRVP